MARAATARAQPAPARTRARPKAKPAARPAPRRRVAGGVFWIGAVAVLLAGVVALNVAVLRTNMALNDLNKQQLELQAQNATLAANDMLTERLDANVTVAGEAQGDLMVRGTVRVLRADLQIPDKLPQSVAVLPVRVPPLRERVDDLPALVEHFAPAGASYGSRSAKRSRNGRYTYRFPRRCPVSSTSSLSSSSRAIRL